MDWFVACTKGFAMNDPIERGDGGTGIGPVNDSNVDTTSIGPVNIADDQNKNESFIPDAPIELKPRIGMEFATLDDAFDFYNKYAWQCGFSVRKDTTRKLKSGVISKRVLRCSKAGARDMRDVHIEPSKRRACLLTRCYCPAKIAINLKAQENTYLVTKFVEDHNHALCTPSKTHRLRSHKRLTDEHISMIATLKASGIGVARSIDFMRSEVGGPSHLGFSERDVRNAMARKRQSRFGSDAEALLQYFLNKQKEDTQFSYDVQVDENMQMKSCFWVDGKSKEDYMAFNDVVCFDTTYKTNEYDMPFGPFVGVNHHMQTILFGAGLLFGETIQDFEWLFQAWLDAMGGVHPKTIITDQDAAIKQAVATIFPNTHHVLCLWHINKKLPNKLAHIIHNHPTFMATWNNSLYGSKGIEGFEKQWDAMIEEYNLQSNSWLQHMYEIRHMWIPVYTREIFTAGMRTTGRSESVNAFFDGFVNHKSSLMDFANGYEKAIEKRREAEKDADFQNTNGRPVLKTKCGIEAAMAEVYTFKVFLAFQEEVEGSMYYIANLYATEGLVEQWHIYNLEKSSEHSGKIITWNVDEMVASCPCMKFESCGIVCRHIITLLGSKE